jgi:hypothetical protein
MPKLIIYPSHSHAPLAQLIADAMFLRDLRDAFSIASQAQ